MRGFGEIWLAFGLAFCAIVLGVLISNRLALSAASPLQKHAVAAARPGAALASESAASSNEAESGEEKVDEQIEQRKKELSAEQNYVCFQKGTEPPFSGKYYKNQDPGMYICVVCSNPLFESDTKFDSGTGWPSFWEMAEPGHVATHEDRSHGMVRTEVTCANCGSHLGHVFDDGPKPTGLRYCINSLSLEFIPAEEWKQRESDESKTDK